MYTLIIIKHFNLKYKKSFCLLNIRMINLSFDELRLIAQIRNISGYENKSKEVLIKALSEPKSESPKPEIPKPEIPKLKKSKEISQPEIPKPKTPKLKKIKSDIIKTRNTKT